MSPRCLSYASVLVALMVVLLVAIFAAGVVNTFLGALAIGFSR